MNHYDPETNPFTKMGSYDGLMYYGERAGWSLVDSLGYDPTALDRANFAALAQAMGFEPTPLDDRGDFGGDDTDDVAIENYGGAFGKGQWLLVRPGSEAERIAYECHAKMDDYPVLDEELWSEFESDDEVENVTQALQSEWDRDTLATAVREWRKYRKTAS